MATERHWVDALIDRGYSEEEAVDLLCNAFASDKQRRAFFAKLAADKAAGGGGGSLLQPADTPGKKTTASKLAEMMNMQTEGQLDVQAVKARLNDESPYFVKTKVSIDKLVGFDDVDVDPSKASPTKGAIIIGASGFIFDGRHRTAAAKKRGETEIEAWVPIQAPER